jgi:phosphoribosylformylglycinamidine synthase
MVACVGVLEDIDTRMSMKWSAGDEVLLVGGGEPSLGGSEYLAFLKETIAGVPPTLEMAAEKRLIQFLQALGAGVRGVAAHDVSAGGLAVAVAEMALTSNVGVSIDDAPDAGRQDLSWFGESATRVLVAAKPEQVKQVTLLAREWDLPVTRIGRVGGESLVLPDGASVELDVLREASESALMVGVEAEMA